MKRVSSNRRRTPWLQTTFIFLSKLRPAASLPRVVAGLSQQLIQRKEFKYDLPHQHRVSVQRFET